MTDRFYSALYRKLLDPGLASSQRQAMFLNLIFQATKDDEDLNRVRVSIIKFGAASSFLFSFVIMILHICMKTPMSSP